MFCKNNNKIINESLIGFNSLLHLYKSSVSNRFWRVATIILRPALVLATSVGRQHRNRYCNELEQFNGTICDNHTTINVRCSANFNVNYRTLHSYIWQKYMHGCVHIHTCERERLTDSMAIYLFHPLQEQQRARAVNEWCKQINSHSRCLTRHASSTDFMPTFCWQPPGGRNRLPHTRIRIQSHHVYSGVCCHHQPLYYYSWFPTLCERNYSLTY